MPPIPPAVQMTPLARARRLQNQWLMAEMDGVKSSEADMPPRMLKVRKKCVNSNRQLPCNCALRTHLCKGRG